MNNAVRTLATSLLAASLLVALGACKKIDPDAPGSDGADTAAADPVPDNVIVGRFAREPGHFAAGREVTR